MAKPPAATSTEAPSFAETLAALTARVDDLAGILGKLPSRTEIETLAIGATTAIDDYNGVKAELAIVTDRLAATQRQVTELGRSQAELRQDVADLQSGGVVAHLAGAAGPAIDPPTLGGIHAPHMGFVGIDLAGVSRAEAADALGIAIGRVFSAVRRADGRIGVVTVDGRKLIEGDSYGDQADEDQA